MVDEALNTFFKLEAVKKFIAYATLFTAITFVLGSFNSLLFLLDVTETKSVDIFGRFLVGQSVFSITVLGYVVYRNRLCAWSKQAFKSILVYYLAFIIDKFIIDLGVKGLIFVNSILLFYVISSCIKLLKNKLKCHKD